MSFVLFGVAFVLSRKKEFSFLFTNKVFIYGGLYLLVAFINYAFVLNDLFFKVYDELTPLWISLFRRVITVLYIYLTFKDEKQAMKLFYFYCGGLVLSSFASYPEMFILKHHLFDAAVAEGNEGYQRAIGFFSSPNDFALTTIIAFIFTLNVYTRTKRPLSLFISLLLIPPVFLSYSRNGMACLVLAIILTYYIGKGLKFRTIFYLAGIFIGLCLVAYLVPSIRERILLSFSGEDTSAVGRYIVILAAYDKWLTMPFWGIGIFSAPLLMEGLGNAGLLITIHNFYAHTLFEAGIIGFAIVLLFLHSIYKLAAKIWKTTTVSPAVSGFGKSALIALIVTYVYIFSGNHIIFEFFWYLMGVLLVIRRSIVKKTNIQKKLLHEPAVG
jgi:O-antigen ligase